MFGIKLCVYIKYWVCARTCTHKSPCDIEILSNTTSEDLPLIVFYAC